MKPIPGYEGLYSISENGEVYSHFLGRVRRPYIGTAGYDEIDLYKCDIRRKWKIHRLLALTFLGMGKKDIIDHADRNIRNNALSNLRVCDRSQNMWNSRIRKNNKSGHTGIYLCRKTGKWYGQVMVRLTSHWLGYFDTKEQVIEAHKKKKQELCGQFTPH